MENYVSENKTYQNRLNLIWKQTHKAMKEQLLQVAKWLMDTRVYVQQKTRRDKSIFIS